MKVTRGMKFFAGRLNYSVQRSRNRLEQRCFRIKSGLGPQGGGYFSRRRYENVINHRARACRWSITMINSVYRRPAANPAVLQR